MRLSPKIPFLATSSSKRVQYFARDEKRFNLILAVDSYKLSHAFAYPKNIHGMVSYIEARTGGRDIIVPFGMQAFLQRFFKTAITQADIDEAEEFATAHGLPFARKVWEHILVKYNGYLPVLIRGVPEGTPVRSGNALYTIICIDREVAENIFWLCSYIETVVLRAVWYPTTIASMDRAIKQDIKRFYELTGAPTEGPDSLLPFALHDFGGRGVTCHEQAEIGGGAHTVNFMGSDTIEGVQYANYWYHEAMSAFSVPATEHSVQCSFSLGSPNRETELKYIRNTIEKLGKKGGIVSIVIDGYDVYRAAEILCVELKEVIENSGCKVVFRPDSGDMFEVVPRILKLQAATFGYNENNKRYKKINYVGIIQGDGVDHEAIKKMLKMITDMGFRADNVIFGSGGALLQKVNRDTFKFAQKASAVLVEKDGQFEWVGISKDPITDPGKRSKEGVLTLARSRMTGQVQTIRIDQEVDDEWEDMMVDLFDCGNFYNETTMPEVRARAAV